jgi:hypothetical protein
LLDFGVVVRSRSSRACARRAQSKAGENLRKIES